MECGCGLDDEIGNHFATISDSHTMIRKEEQGEIRNRGGRAHTMKPRLQKREKGRG
jgi:hypothetical protein